MYTSLFGGRKKEKNKQTTNKQKHQGFYLAIDHGSYVYGALEVPSDLWRSWDNLSWDVDIMKVGDVIVDDVVILISQ